MPDLTDVRESLNLVRSLLSKCTDTLTRGPENAPSTGETGVSVHTDTTLTPTDTPAGGSAGVSALSVLALTPINAVQYEEKDYSVSVSVQFAGKNLRDWEIFTPETLERLLDQGVTTPTVVELEGTGKIRIYPTRDWLERERGKNDAVEFYAEELRRALPLLRDAYARRLAKEPLQLASWAADLLNRANEAGAAYPVLVELVDPEPETQSLSRLCESQSELERTLAELSRYNPSEARLLKTKTLERLVVVTTTEANLRVCSTPPADYILVTEQNALHEAVTTLRKAPAIGLDLETTGLDPYTDRIRLMSLSDGVNTYLVDAFHLKPQIVVDTLRPLMDGPKLVIHNAAFDTRFLHKLGLGLPKRLHDTGLSEQLLTSAARMPKLLDLAQQYAGLELDKSQQNSEWTGDLSQEQLRYAALDAWVVLPIYSSQIQKISETGLERVYDIEHAALPAIVWMTDTGVPLDRDRWLEVAQAEEARVTEALRELDPNVNWASPKQVLEALHRSGLSLPDTSYETLAKHRDHPVVQALLCYREHSKRLGTYGANWLEHLHPVTGRIHPSWWQIGAETGRMSCSSPNLMQVPREPLYRACFRAPEDRVFVKADYSQIELRLAALIAKDKVMLEAFERGEDLHTKTAIAVTGKAREQITKGDRQLAKALNFGLLYGMGAETLRSYALAGYGVALTSQEATELRERFFRTYSGLRKWHRSQGDGEAEIRTLTGRRRVTNRFTEKLNTPVQGSGADILKLALALLWERRHEMPGAHPVLAVHDELVVEAPANLADQARAHLEQAMLEAAEKVTKGGVPIEVEAGVYRDWGVESAT